ncbi:hypothetical protein S7711_04707 [Stachybotrys chartarum IBT 7711]|uniref:Xylanolytic transcriptional activator regulatory domain-containing protein n=1 Tax=Stachybotrys chartarum (strain CBS 109288 / IBT 7711) TaxID=1280523 RepID=A0A084ANZ6_STACB|nr:hypothetical protein S7711_04707 [Stachybotrys chartarum IBT 7711]KFA53754.1 hypothetical protein S40293_01633 [Stachybotrys chartarum IBT 40293]
MLLVSTEKNPGSRGQSKLELDIADIRTRLGQITDLLVASQSQPRRSPDHQFPSQETPASASGSFGAAIPSAFAPSSPVGRGGHGSGVDGSEFPFMIIQSRPMMDILGLSPDTAQWLVNAERAAAESSGMQQSFGAGALRMFMLQSQPITAALAAFSEHVHTWYPLFSADFTEAFSSSISEPNPHSVQSCLAMLVVAIGSLANHRDTNAALHERPGQAYYEAAVALLPAALQGYSLPSLQCLVLFALYQLCLIRPCQAHDYITIASFRAQNMLRSRTFPEGSKEDEGLRRAFWVILLVESEIAVQLDLPHSGIWAYEDIALPATTEAWHFAPPLADAEITETSPHSQSCTSSDSVLVYFLAEIAMRRMLQRCTTSVNMSAGGQLLYAPVIAQELELQLNEWYKCLPVALRFHMSPTSREDVAELPAAQFLQTQYFACKASIYWPAVYQAMELSAAYDELLQFCNKFFDSFVSFALAASAAVKTCLVNSWTLNSRLEPPRLARFYQDMLLKIF